MAKSVGRSVNRSSTSDYVFSVRIDPSFQDLFSKAAELYEQSMGISLSRAQVLSLLVKDKLKEGGVYDGTRVDCH